MFEPSVPGVDTKFSVGWKRIHSIEEGLKEIFWALDKTSREWRLWIWTQQFNFLDSTTKKIKIADNFAFTIDVNIVDIAERMPKHSQYYKEKKLKNDNIVWQVLNGVRNPLNIPKSKNRYLVVWVEWEIVNDLSAAANPDQNRAIQWDLGMVPEASVNLSQNSDAYRYNIVISHVARLMDQWWTLWINVADNASEMDSYAQMLLLRKNRRRVDWRFNKSQS